MKQHIQQLAFLSLSGKLQFFLAHNNKQTLLYNDNDDRIIFMFYNNMSDLALITSHITLCHHHCPQ